MGGRILLCDDLSDTGITFNKSIDWLKQYEPIKDKIEDIKTAKNLNNKNIEVGKILIDKPYSFALIKVVEPDLKEFTNIELMCGTSKVKILKPEWIT